MSKTIYWLIATLIAILWSSAALLDGPDDVQAHQDQQAMLEDAIANARAAYARHD